MVIPISQTFFYPSKVERHLSQAADLSPEEAAEYSKEVKKAAWAARVRGTCFAWCA